MVEIVCLGQLLRQSLKCVGVPIGIAVGRAFFKVGWQAWFQNDGFSSGSLCFPRHSSFVGHDFLRALSCVIPQNQRICGPTRR
jgi:hypothetical protein